MSENDEDERRVRFFGVHDLAAGLYAQRMAELAEQFDPAKAPKTIADIIELHNVQLHLEHGFFPHEYSKADRARAKDRISKIRGAVARFFSSIDDTNCSTLITDVNCEYHADLLALLGRNRAFERCSPEAMLPTLDRAGIRLGEMLASKKLVGAYDREIRDQLRASPQNAEHLIRKYLQNDVRDEIHIPASFTPSNARELLESYVDSQDANPNYVGLIEAAQIDASAGIDAKLKLRAKRRNAEMTRRLFERTAGWKTGCEVGISDTQDDSVKFEMDESDGLVARYTYSCEWLDKTCNNPSILNNFQHLFEFADGHVLLTMPSYPSNLGVVERSTVAMMCRTRLICRLPAGERRWRTWSPEDASIGAVPVQDAKWLRSRNRARSPTSTSSRERAADAQLVSFNEIRLRLGGSDRCSVTGDVDRGRRQRKRFTARKSQGLGP